MAKSHPLVLILSLALFGIALAVIVWVFTSNNMSARRDALVAQMTGIATDATRYRHLPRPQGGGGSYAGYAVPKAMRSTKLGEFTATDSAGAALTIVATSAGGGGRISAILRRDGELREFRYDGEFAPETSMTSNK
jgi:hypothetical protein